jgi:ethanolaminephosphotransferase
VDLSPAERAHLRTRQHDATTDHSSWARRLGPWWSFALRFVPTWVAPNVLTVLGSAAVAVPTAALLVVSPGLDRPPPAALILASIVGVFVFQTLDALDGKQARRLGVSSPLGSWLDHALDILTMQLVLVGLAATLTVGAGPAAWLLLAGTIVNNFALHWEAAHTRALTLGDGTSITDAQLMAMAVHAMALGFPEVMRGPLAALAPPLAGLPLVGREDVTVGAAVLVVAVAVVGGAGLVASLRRGQAGARAAGIGAGRALAPLVAPTALVAVAGLALLALDDPRAERALAVGVLAVGVRAVGRVVLENLVRRPLTIVDPALAVVGVLTIAAGSLVAIEAGGAARLTAWGVGAVGLAALGGFFVDGARTLCAALDERLFVLAPREAEGAEAWEQIRS